MVASTARLRLRHVVPADAGFLLRLLNQPSWIANIGDRQVHSVEEARGYIERRMAPSYSEHGFGLYLLELASTGAPLGLCGLLKRDFLADPDLGFALLEEHWGRGYAEEAARAVVRHAFDEIGLERLLAIVTPANQRSSHLLTKLGFALRGHVQVEDEDLRLYGCAR